jgi:hypothetical protein
MEQSIHVATRETPWNKEKAACRVPHQEHLCNGLHDRHMCSAIAGIGSPHILSSSN